MTNLEKLQELINELSKKNYDDGEYKFENGEYYWSDGEGGEYMKMDIYAMNDTEVDKEIEDLSNLLY